MGLTASSTAKAEPSQLQRDIKYLGDRMPFGDDELVRIYKAYNSLHEPERTEKETSDSTEQNDAAGGSQPQTPRSFLTDFGSKATSFSKSTNAEERRTLLAAVEQTILPQGFGNALYKSCFLRPQDTSEYEGGGTNASVVDDDYTRMLKLEKFFDGLSNCGRRGAKGTLKSLVACCASKQDDPKMISPTEIVEIGYRSALACAFLQAREGDDVSQFLPASDSRGGAIQALANSLIACARRRKQRAGDPTAYSEDIEFVSEEDVLEWGESVVPLFSASLASLMHMVCFPDKPFPATRTGFEYPRIPPEMPSTFFLHGSSPLLFSFGCMSSALSGSFYRLYTSASDGLSFNRLQNSLLGYGGPTLLIIQSGDSIFGAFTASSWKESKDFYGNTDCFLFQLLPTTAVYRPTGSGRSFMYCNSHARSRGYDKQAHGIGFGGNVDQPRLYIAESFDNCRAGPQDLTFENGALLGKSGVSNHTHNFDIDNLEVWGVGGDDVVEQALGARKDARGVRDAAIRKARKVDKAAFLDDFKSGLIESKAFAHRGQIQGRDGPACVDDDDDE